MSISPNVIIMTREEFRAELDASFHKGVRRGRFEERSDQSDQSQAKATEGKAGMAVSDQGHVRRSTAGTGLQVGEAVAVQPATSEIMGVTAGETAPFPSDPPSQEASAPVELREAVIRIINEKVEIGGISDDWERPTLECVEEAADAILSLPGSSRDEALEEAAKVAESDDSQSHFAITARARIARRIRALKSGGAK